MQRVIFINRFYFPDHSATSQLLTELSEFLANNDKNIHVVASRQMYEDAKAKLRNEELINNVTVHRVYSTTFGRANLVGRAIDYLSFYLFSFIFLLGLVRKNDVLIAKTDPPLISVVAAVVVKIRGGILVNWIQDLFPEVVEGISPGSIPEWLYKFIQKIRNWSLKVARRNIVIGNTMGNLISAAGVNAKTVRVFQNWFVDEGKQVASDEIHQLKKQWGLDGKFVVGYSGNLGRAHDYQTFLNAAISLVDNQDIVFLFIGGGAGMDAMKAHLKERDLSNVIFKPYQPLSNLSLTLSISNVHLISLLPSMEGLIVPSKFYGILAANRPIIFVGSEEGEISGLISRYDCGVHLACGESDLLVKEIQRYNRMDSSLESKRIKQIYNDKFKFGLVARKWLEMLNREL